MGIHTNGYEIELLIEAMIFTEVMCLLLTDCGVNGRNHIDEPKRSTGIGDINKR